jgi:uncharacterized protein HemY
MVKNTFSKHYCPVSSEEKQSFKTQFKAAHKVADVEDELAAYKITKEHLIEDEERDELELKLHFFVVVSLIIS